MLAFFFSFEIYIYIYFVCFSRLDEKSNVCVMGGGNVLFLNTFEAVAYFLGSIDL